MGKPAATDRPCLPSLSHSLTLDCIITGSSHELLAHEVNPLVEQCLGTRGLELSPTKTPITSMEDGFDFLGQHVRTYAGKLLIKPAQKNVKTFLGTIRQIVKANTQATAGNLIAQLNPVIRGWANYHRHVVSKATFIKVDTAIFKRLWAWARRRHPKKTSRWVAKKDFHTRHGRQWTFVGTRAGTQGPPYALALFRAGDVPIQRHVTLKGAANPYAPPWEGYFAERLGVKMTHTLKGRRQWLYLWKQQHGLCPGCHQKLPDSQDGTTILWSGGPLGAKIQQTTVYSCTPTATDRSIAK